MTIEWQLNYVRALAQTNFATAVPSRSRFGEVRQGANFHPLRTFAESLRNFA